MHGIVLCTLPLFTPWYVYFVLHGFPAGQLRYNCQDQDSRRLGSSCARKSTRCELLRILVVDRERSSVTIADHLVNSRLAPLSFGHRALLILGTFSLLTPPPHVVLRGGPWNSCVAVLFQTTRWWPKKGPIRVSTPYVSHPLGWSKTDLCGAVWFYGLNVGR